MKIKEAAMLDILKKHFWVGAGFTGIVFALSLAFKSLNPGTLGVLVITFAGLLFRYALLHIGAHPENALSNKGKRLRADAHRTGDVTASSHNEILSHVLIVEDNPVALLTLSRLFSALGARRIAGSESAEAALRLLSNEKFSLILTDYKLGGMDGVQLLEKIRKDGDETPVIVLSARPDQSGVIRAARFNHTDFFGKPLRKLELLKTLERFSSAHLSHAGRFQA